MLILNIVPCSLNNFFQKFLRKVGSLSSTMDAGILCYLTTSLTKTSARDWAVNGFLM